MISTRSPLLINFFRNGKGVGAGPVGYVVADKVQAFAGLDPTQYDVLWVRHNHEDRVELHFCTPRLELSSGRSLNIAPPGYEKAFDSLRDVMNQRHG
ncbi:MAG: relaxase/mobilization nuclease domain-containing protein [Planktotalea sp.]|uniref:relaxase/mobilization nuclease domain-containing protein n=1 Tax=Planktotalea sp. TaxID=2029877 RepID=UPI0002EE09FE|nr:relaxase/mobilization nuclease domain-containing protein [Planktotalea sp.]MDG1075745.1 relaxase/mobilization nuclease domain-containing protein [Planktotalea sp.]MDG1084609.1 relaxase/mobilization nuclease domain-containing protein [Planktotalea sp.]